MEGHNTQLQQSQSVSACDTHRLTKSRRWFLVCFCFLLGVAIASFLDLRIVSFDSLLWWTSVVLLCLSMCLPKQYTVLAACCCLMIVAGIYRYVYFFAQLELDIRQAIGQQSVYIHGVISAEPDVRQNGVRYIVASELLAGEPSQGNVYVSYDLYPRFSYGEEVRLTCTLEAPEPLEDDDGRVFRYDLYLARYNVFALCRRPTIQSLGTTRPSVFQKLFAFKETYANVINQYWPEPYAGFMAGLLYGYRGGLGSLNEQFSRTGTTHIIAISGYNITIVGSLLLGACYYLRIKRQYAFYLVVVGIIVFVIFAGASASVVRAGIMGIIVLFARHIGRASAMGNTLITTAVIMTAYSPLVLIYDAGFQLSFLSTLGLVYLSPKIEPYATWIPKTGEIRESFVATVSATIITLPLILFQFGRLSTVALPTNMLILWILPYVMTLGFFVTVFSAIFTPVAEVFAWLSFVGMKYVTMVVAWFSNFSFAAIDIDMSVWWMIGCYGLMGWLLWKKQGS